MPRYSPDGRILLKISPEDLVNRSFEIPDGVKAIGWGGFSGCSDLTAVFISDSVTTIEELAFNQCSGLTAVFIPGSMTAIGMLAFRGCSKLQVVVIDAQGDEFERVKGLLPEELRSKAMQTNEYQQIKAIQVKACRTYLAEIVSVPADIWGVVEDYEGGYLSAEMQSAINTVRLPNRKEDRWHESYLKALSEALSAPPAHVEERETNSRERCGESDMIRQHLALSASSFYETERQEPRPHSTPDSDSSRCRCSMM